MAEATQPVRPKARPLSPHLQIYKWPVTMATSILHRGTGLALSAGVLVLTAWLVSAALGPEAFAVVDGWLGHWLGQLALFGFTVALVYHTLNGVRHLAWDMGYGFRVKTADLTGWLVLALTAVISLGIWVAAARLGA